MIINSSSSNLISGLVGNGDHRNNGTIVAEQLSNNQIDGCFSATPTTTTTTSTIVNFYHNRSVLITGGSGFIGKVLIEKLLRCCPGIKRIFVLIRPKWNKKPHERLVELLGSPLFDGVRGRGIEVEKKVLLVEGDVTEQHLGLSDQNLLRIMNEVSIIFHSAATVKFDEPLKQSIAINIAGVKNMIEVCRKIPNLAALVHVSTAYANCDKQEIDEHIYPVAGGGSQLDPEKLIEMANWLDQDTLQELKFKLLGARPNTYTYTKALAEWLLVKSARDLPVVICRPSIVVASHREPFCGWIDNCNGPTGIILGAGKGLIRTMLAEKSFVADLVPVDTVINLLVTLGWFAHVYRNHKNDRNNELLESQTESLMGSDSASADAESLDGSDDAVVVSTTTTTNLNKLNHISSSNNNNNSSSIRAGNMKVAACIRASNDCNGNNNNNNNNNSSPLFVHHHNNLSSAIGDDDDRSNKSLLKVEGMISKIGNSESTAAAAGTAVDLNSSIGKTDGDQQQKQEQHPEILHLFDSTHTGVCNQATELAHLDDGYGTQSPDYRFPSTSSSSSSSSLKHAKLTSSTSSSTSSAASGLILSTGNRELMATDHNLLVNTNDQYDKYIDYNIESCNLIENEKFQSFVAQRRLAEEKHADFEYKLKQFRHNTQLKLAAKNLPEDLADIPVFHCTSGADNPITWGRIQTLTVAELILSPSLSIYRYPNAAFTNSTRKDSFFHWTLHLIPAYIADFVAKLFGRKQTIVRIFQKYEQAANVLKAFTMKEWTFNADNRMMLYNELLSDEDRTLFNCDLVTVDWRDFFAKYVLGVRRYILKESDDTIEQARVNMRYIYYRNSAIQILFMAMIAYYFLV